MAYVPVPEGEVPKGLGSVITVAKGNRVRKRLT